MLIILRDFKYPLNVVTDSQCAERVILHIETAEFISDNTELTSLFIQVQDMTRNRLFPTYITHIWSHTGLPVPLAQGNADIDKLINMLQAPEFHKKYHFNTKGLKKEFSITWQQAKVIIKKCPTCFSIMKHHCLQGLIQSVLKGMKSGRRMCSTLQNVAN